MLSAMQTQRRELMTSSLRICWVVDAGRIPYGPACELQRQLVEARKARVIPDVLLLCEHPHVFTLGRNGKREHLLVSGDRLARENVELHATNRGGDITYHGPGQIIAYPILDLGDHRRDVRWYVEQLEEIMIRTTADFGIAARRVEGRHGVWVDAPGGEEKIGALGVHISRWVTSHGLAYNVSTDLRYFDWIVPCGIRDKRATSLAHLTGRTLACDQVRERMMAHFADVFGLRLERVSRGTLAEAVAKSTSEVQSVTAAV